MKTSMIAAVNAFFLVGKVEYPPGEHRIRMDVIFDRRYIFPMLEWIKLCLSGCQ